MLRYFSREIILIAMIVSLSAGILRACGPFFPNRVLLDGDNVVLKAPIASFRKEIERIKPPVPTQFEAVIPTKKGGYYTERYSQQTATIDVAEVENALAGRNLSEEHRYNIIEKYRAAREVILEYVTGLSRWQNERKWSWRTNKYDLAKVPKPQFNAPLIPEGLPGEFEDYLRGAIFYHQGEPWNAVDAWLDLLNRPVQERLYRSTWAAFMIGKTLLEAEPAEAIEWFQIVRQLAEEGFVDSLGLASSSLGWEARAALSLEHYERAIGLYVAQMATGDPTAILSLQFAAGKALRSEQEVLEEIARNATARKVITAYVISRRRTWDSWLSAVESAEVSAVEEAEQLALASYQMGEMDIAQRWLDVAPPDTILARWVRAKLLLRAGKVPEAAEQLVPIASWLPPAQQPRSGYQGAEAIEIRIRGELGVLHLARRQYIEALDVLLQGGYWEDAAYVAERVLTPDELIEYVNLKWAPLEQTEISEKDYGIIYNANNPNWFRIRIRYLLARRLARIRRWDEARAYYPAKWQERFDAYIQAIRDGENEYISSRGRAAALWKAACITRYEGMELLGTEVEPDWFVYSGNFKRTPASEIRGFDGDTKIVPSTADEQRRLRRNFVPEKRFHYRYTAAECAWRAAELMPDESDETARVLCIAGSWLKVRDPQAADRFYKTLVLRCGKTQLGREADKLRWFPKIKIDKNKLLEGSPNAK